MIIAVDFDGTIVEHMYPQIGRELPHAIRTLKELKERGDTVILLTMRSGFELGEAVQFCKKLGFEFTHVNENPAQKTWTTSPKVYAQLYIDDAALGAPVEDSWFTDRKSINWTRVRAMLGMPV